MKRLFFFPTFFVLLLQITIFERCVVIYPCCLLYFLYLSSAMFSYFTLLFFSFNIYSKISTQFHSVVTKRFYNVFFLVVLAISPNFVCIYRFLHFFFFYPVSHLLSECGSSLYHFLLVFLIHHPSSSPAPLPSAEPPVAQF